MLFVDFSSAFNTVIPSKLITKLGDLGISTPLRYWIMDFLTNRPQHVKSGHNCSSTITLNTGTPQGCVLSPFLYSLFTHDCRPMYGSNSITKFADDITVIGLISDNDESHYRAEVEHLATWCADNNLLLNTNKTKELIVDFQEGIRPCPSWYSVGVLREYGVRGAFAKGCSVSVRPEQEAWFALPAARTLQHVLERFAAECEAAGMRISTSKSEAMVLDRKRVACPLQVGGEVLPQVEEFKYLGVLFTSEGKIEREIDRRIGAASVRSYAMRSVYRTVVVKKELSRKAKLSIYRSIYVPTLTYGHELWVMTERTRSRIQAAEMSFLHRVAGRSLRDRVRSSVTREELGVEPLLLQHREESAEVAWASVSDAPWTPP
ncbi:hypothetical protein L3Q82_021871 [Scortum barcoo]|uniref:Uncharacterized protein n=1 Tax=Scortum barcoo TaxID=214431 RepID=A0ACB8X789_9TELE|nr:hypothetical protein L3Q82_021871 [Scortum barcoo]